ncbi:TPA: hypothetical protein MHS89_24020 [Klebsiella pneumoniae]|uniref:Uncharacterized protein n=2 Tax=Enterobacterales TaxID=91347 RepID=A0AAW9PKG3_KLEVA|nr:MULTISPECIES: hypothetical protein [Enterobacterales]EAZ0882366.1 hypothetical protein [Salmonella enterica]ECS6963960.1 hypothetical protein [Salmonella enterica subsp. enterica serovar Ouakam]EHM2024735.1 hypothetical protein [Salmonella enterica subsp. enterica]EKN5163109.1 hypothetical protein [Yersinia enterocolitica]ELI8802027.1 hypothetical protein [Klebsiella michiganensis]
MELEKVLKFSVEDGKSLTDDEVIEVYKLIEVNIEHVRFSHNDFFIYLSDRYLDLSIAMDEKDREKEKSRKSVIRNSLVILVVMVAIYGSAKLVSYITKPSELDIQQSQAYASLRIDAINRKQQALQFLKSAPDVSTEDLSLITSTITNSGISFGDSFVLQCQEYGEKVAINTLALSPNLSSETIKALQQAVDAQCELYNLDKQ